MPAAFIPAANTARVEMVYTYGGSTCENVYHCTMAAQPTLTTLTALVGRFASWESVTAKLVRNADVRLDHIKATDVSVQDGATYTEDELIDGTKAGAPLPPSNTFAVKAATGLAGRSFRGRTYWIGLVEDDVSSNPSILNGAPIAAIVGALNTLRTTLSGASTPLVVASYRHAGAARAAAVLTPITQWVSADSYIDVQRRRLLGHNRHR